MATSLSGFRSAFPECNTTASDLNVLTLLQATKVNETAWGSDFETVVYLTIAEAFAPKRIYRALYVKRMSGLSNTRQAFWDGVTEERLDLIQNALDVAQADATAAQESADDAQADADTANAAVTALDGRLDTAEATLDDHEDRIVALEP